MSRRSGGPTGPSYPPEDWPNSVRIIPEIAPYRKPDRGPEKEKEFLKQMYESQRISETDIALKYLNKAQERILADCPLGAPIAWGGDLPEPSHVLNCIRNLKPNANPGFPFNLSSLGKREFAIEHFPEIYHLVCLRILALRYLFHTDMTPSQILSAYCADPVACMIKNEVLKKEKRPRMIGMTSVVTEIVDRLLVDDVSFEEIASWGTFYSCIGIGFGADSSNLLHEVFRGVDVATSDVPSFDASRTEAEAILDFELLAYQIQCKPGSFMYVWAYNKMLCANRSVFYFTDGVLWAQKFFGTNKSGRKETSKDNTASRARRSEAASIYMSDADPSLPPNVVRCAGDDCIERHYPGKELAYAALGFPLRDYESSSGVIEFCSHTFHPGEAPVGKRIVKAVANLLFTRETSTERLSSFVREFFHHPELPHYLSKIFEARPKIYLTQQKFQQQSYPLASSSSSPPSLSLSLPQYHKMGLKSKAKKTINVVAKTASVAKSVGRVARRVPGLNNTPFVRHPMETTGGLFGPGGRAAGKILGVITGSGDYRVTQNTIMTESTHTLSPNVPGFTNNSDGSTTVRHREFIGDVISSSTPGAFKLQTFNINPGLSTVFPWLSVIAMQFDQWRPDGLVFTFKSTSSSYSGGASQALGTVIMATDYDVTDLPYANKIEMNNSQFAISCKSDHTMLHPIECDPAQRPIRLLKCRDGVAVDNAQWYDLGNFQIATEGIPVANTNVGELWVTYQVTFFKEQLYGGVYGASVLESIFSNTISVAVNAPFGANANRVSGPGNKIPNITVTPNTVVQTNALIGSEFSIEYYIQGAAAAANFDTPVLAGATLIPPVTGLMPVSEFIGIGAGTTICMRKMNFVITATTWSLTVTAGTYPAFPSSFLRITQLNRANY